jgi:hypothetical protein
MSAPGASDGLSAVQGALHFKAPEGWTAVAPTAMRNVNFQAGNPALECYVTMLAGDGGGALPNVNRWREQVGLPAASAAELGHAAHPDVRRGSVLVEAGRRQDDHRHGQLRRGRRFVKLDRPSALAPQEGPLVAFAEPGSES